MSDKLTDLMQDLASLGFLGEPGFVRVPPGVPGPVGTACPTGPKGPIGNHGEPEPPVINAGDHVVFRPPIPRCQYQGGIFVGASDDPAGVTCRVRLDSGLVIGVSLSRIKKAGWLESLALQAK